MCPENSKHWKEDDDRKLRASSVKEREILGELQRLVL